LKISQFFFADWQNDVIDDNVDRAGGDYTISSCVTDKVGAVYGLGTASHNG
jgi:hypothetical protein